MDDGWILGVLFIFLLLFGNAQIAFSFSISNFFRSTRGCVIFSFLWIFGSGFIGIFLLDSLFPNDATYNYFIELIPPFAVYRFVCRNRSVREVWCLEDCTNSVSMDSVLLTPIP